EGGYAVSYEARGGGWFVARDTGDAVRGRVVDVAVFSDDAYRYVTMRFPHERDEKTGKWRDVVKVYRMRYAKEWTRISDG
ncbi:MAG TPA: hypothetical protein VMW93_01645, partial [bacterium]|nr:hypothetical protein [bacterium]